MRVIVWSSTREDLARRQKETGMHACNRGSKEMTGEEPVDRKSCDKSQFWGGGVIVLSIYDGQEHRNVQPTHVHVVHVLDPCSTCVMTPVVQGS